MGFCINPGNEGFSSARKGRYIDKSGIISLINKEIDGKDKLFCVSRPRRFGKSYAAQMLCAYYCVECDSEKLFNDLEIASDNAYREHLNKYNVLYLDVSSFLGKCKIEELTKEVCKTIISEIKAFYPDIDTGMGIDYALAGVVDHTGTKFVAIIDEWDSPIRDSKSNSETQKEYLDFLRLLFKNSSATDKIFSAAYMTGILPIKKDGSQSAVSEFDEFTMISPRRLAPYFGFVEGEVESLCKEYDMDFRKMKEWYDGYELPIAGPIYNPNSVMEAIKNNSFESYWRMSSSATSLLDFINLDFDGLLKAVEKLIGGDSVQVNTRNFQNDMINFSSKDDVLTLLIHFGYLCYESGSESVYIPNEEVRQEFADVIRRVSHKETLKRIQESDKLIRDVVEMNESAVAEQIEKIHRTETDPLFYNNEQSLRSVIKLAFFAYKDKYTQLEELPSGNGYADIVYLPKKQSNYPILVIELKWDETAETAIDQIRKRNYPEKLKERNEDIILVGVSYDKDDREKKHHCKIERI
ncbi:PD-(D/E)XK nuclease superfamily protein [Lachnospiraceae bacterium]|nr:PD-(D/E)XK nuclease superfamily protein [Lachnospiraceae bacterium]